MRGPDQAFWQDRFETGQTGWDRGAPSPQLQAWLAAGALPPGRVLVPGCGRGWEVEALARHGAEVTGIDYAPAAVSALRTRLASSSLSARIEQADVLHWQPDQPVDAIYEQTCLCALHPEHWRRYSEQLHAWLRPGGTLLALFLQYPRPGAVAEGLIEGPPYHCDINAMRALFPEARWTWPAPPYTRVAHPKLLHELAVVLQRR